MRTKRIFKLFLILMLFLSMSLTSCSLFFYKEENNLKSSYTCINYTYSQNEMDSMYNDIKKVDEYLDGIRLYNPYDFVDCCNNVFENMFLIRRYYTIEYLSYCIKGYNENREKYLMYMDALNDCIKFRTNLFKKAYNSKYHQNVFSDMTDEEIQELLENHYSDKYYDLSEDQERLISEYESLSSTEVQELGYKYIADLINLNTKIVNEIDNYDNYIEYEYKEAYSRNYDYNLTKNYDVYLKKYLFDYIKDIKNEYKELYDYNKLNDTKMYKVYNDFTNGANYTFGYLTNYAKYLSDNVQDNYEGKDFYRSYISLINSNKKLFKGTFREGAFTTLLFNYKNGDVTSQPVIYISDTYYEPSTLIHEFGHYMAYLNCGFDDISYDLAETHSQTDEALFWSYLYNISDLGEDAKLYRDYQLLYGLKIVILAAIVNSIEIELYEKAMNLTLTEEIIDKTIEDVLENDYNGFDSIFDDTTLDFDIYNDDKTLKQSAVDNIKSYFKRVAVDNSLYYISYSTSFLTTLSIYSSSLGSIDNYNVAINNYLNLLTKSGDLVDAVKDIGITSPFDEETFIKLVGDNQNEE